MTRYISAFVSLAVTLTIVSVSLFWATEPAGASNITVNTTVDELNANGNCTLREAIQSANTDSAIDACTAGSGDDVIDLPAGTYIMSIAGSGEDSNATGDFDITSNLAINGAAAGTTIVDGDDLDRVFDIFTINGPLTVTIAGLTVTNGGDLGSEDGGGIANDETLTLSGVIVTSNDGDDGGGIDNDGDLTINDSTISNNTTSDADDGGGIRNLGTLEINRSTIIGNEADTDGGGGISNLEGEATLSNVTVSGNSTAGAGGGISNNGELNLNNVTIAGNSATLGGGGLADGQVILKSVREIEPGEGDYFVSAGTSDGTARVAALGITGVTATNTIVASNPTGGDCLVEDLTSSGHNLDGDNTCTFDQTTDKPGVDPQLAALADNGGPTQTRAIPATSPATDAGDPATCLAEDQRGFGFARPQDGNNDGTAVCDIGAYEREAAGPTPGGPTTTPNSLAPSGGGSGAGAGASGPSALPGTGGSRSSAGGEIATASSFLVIVGISLTMIYALRARSKSHR